MKKFIVLFSGILAALATVLGIYSGVIEAYRTKLFPWPGEKSAWDQIPWGKKGSCEALRQIKDGYYAEKATDIIIRRRTINDVSSEIRETNIPEEVILASDLEPAATEVMAKQATLSLFQSEIEKSCRGFSEVDGSVFIRATSNITTADAVCLRDGNGYRCGVTHDYNCAEHPKTIVEVCGEPKTQVEN